MSYTVWARRGRLALLSMLIPGLLGAFGGVIAFFVSFDPSALAVAAGAIAYMLLMIAPVVVCIRRHERELRRAIAERLGLGWADHRVDGVLEGVPVVTELVRTLGRNGKSHLLWRLVAPGDSIPCSVQPSRRSLRFEVDGVQVASGDEAFDRCFVVHARDPAAAREYLTAPRRKVLAKIDGESPDPWFLRPDGLIVWYGLEWQDDHEHGAALLRAMAASARELFSA